MRSVFFHLVGVTRQVVADRLSSLATVNGQESWYLPRGSSTPVLYLCFYGDLLAEAKPAEVDALIVSLGMMPAVTVMVEVSGRSPGDAEVLEFAALMLTEFRGVACDDYTSHCWTLPEIQSGAKIDGHTFFDYDGWYHDRHHRPLV